MGNPGTLRGSATQHGERDSHDGRAPRPLPQIGELGHTFAAMPFHAFFGVAIHSAPALFPARSRGGHRGRRTCGTLQGARRSGARGDRGGRALRRDEARSGRDRRRAARARPGNGATRGRLPLRQPSASPSRSGSRRAARARSPPGRSPCSNSSRRMAIGSRSLGAGSTDAPALAAAARRGPAVRSRERAGRSALSPAAASLRPARGTASRGPCGPWRRPRRRGTSPSPKR